jgi:hypothetical protein
MDHATSVYSVNTMSDKIVIVRNTFSSLPSALAVIEDPKLPPHVMILRSEDWEVLVDAKNGKLTKRKRVKFESVPDYGTLMTWADFIEGVAAGGLDDDDGEGDFATATEVSNILVPTSDIYAKLHHGNEDADIVAQKLKPPYAWATHVHWCNK